MAVPGAAASMFLVTPDCYSRGLNNFLYYFLGGCLTIITPNPGVMTQ